MSFFSKNSVVLFSILTYYFISSGFCNESSTNDETRDAKLLKTMVSSSFNHPSQNGYQSVVLGTEKHKYGYEIKHHKNFHYTSTEKDGVRLGCYGHELNGKKYLTQYVADTKGYRLVTTEDLIIVYPKSGRIGKAVFAEEDFQSNEDNDSEVQQENNHFRNAAMKYVFPKGCKGVDVEIDNSSRLRSLAGPKNFEISPRLPVNFPNRTDQADKYNYYKPSVSYPGPSHIYAPSNLYSNVYLPPPQNLYLPPKNPAETPSTLVNTFNHPNENVACCLPCSNDSGKLVIPIPLKNRKSDDCCARNAQLIIPLKNIDITFVAQLRENLSQKEFDADHLIRNILENLR